MSPKRDWTLARQKCDSERACRNCRREDTHLEAAHVIPRSLGGGMGFDEVVPLCRSCHQAFDAHEIDLLGRLSYAEQAAAVKVVGIERARQRLLPSEYESKVRDDSIPSPAYARGA